MPSRRVEGLCQYYDPAGGKCRKVDLITSEELFNRDVPSLVVRGRRYDYFRKLQPGGNRLLDGLVRSYYQSLCRSKGWGGRVDARSVLQQMECTEYISRSETYKQRLRTL